MTKTPNNRAWWLVLPVFVLVAFSAVVPMMTVVNYSVQDIFDSSTRFFVGADWYRQVLQDPRLHDSLLRQFIFSACVLLIEIPLGIVIALSMPRGGRWASACLIVMAIPLLIPWNVVGTIWQIFGRADIGLLGWALTKLGISYNYASNTMDAWVTVLVMDVWHWTSLVALLCYSGLRAIPRRLLPGGPHRPRFGLGSVPLHPAVEAEKRAADRGDAALHGQLHDLHRALRADRRRPGQCHDLPQPDADQDGRGAVRPGPGSGVLADLLSDHPAGVLAVLYRHDPQRPDALRAAR